MSEHVQQAAHSDAHRSHALDLSIIIVNWNTRDLLADCLQSVYDTVHDLAFEVFVVDNASGDGSAAMVRERFPAVRLIANAQNVGFARANNQAIALSAGEYVLFLNPDTVLGYGAVEHMLRFCYEHPRIGVLGPELVSADGSTQLSWAALPSLWTELVGVHRRKRTVYPCGTSACLAYLVGWVTGACMLVPHRVVCEVGRFDEAFFLYSEETDFCMRVQQAGGLVVYFAGARVVHLGGGSSRQDLPRTALLLFQSKLIYAWKHFGPWQALLLRSAFVLLLLLKGVLRLVSGRPRDARFRFDVARELVAFRPANA